MAAQKVLIAYSHSDKRWKKELVDHLRTLEWQGTVEIWDIYDLEHRADRVKQIEKAVRESNVVVLLISPSFWASDFINSKEFSALLDRANKGDLAIIPILVKPISLTYKLKTLPFFNIRLKPLSSTSKEKRNLVYSSVSGQIAQYVKASAERSEIRSDVRPPDVALDFRDKRQEKPLLSEALQKALDGLQVGQVVYNPPDTMRVGVKERVETRISIDKDADLIISLKGRGDPKSEEMIINELMKVRLSGDDFSIIPLNEEEQIIAAKGFTEWAWNVTPTRSGEKTLHLHITLRLKMDHTEEKKDHPVLDREIVVKVNLVYSIKSFILKYWKWIVTALILPLIGWIWKTYIK